MIAAVLHGPRDLRLQSRPALEPGVGDGTGVGLANVNRRLQAHYGEGVRLRSFPFGTIVRLEVPAQ